MGASSKLVELADRPGITLREEVDLAPFTSIRIGGRCRRVWEVGGIEALAELQRTLHEESLDLVPLGRGQNLLLNDDDGPQEVVRLTGDLASLPHRVEGGLVWVGAGANLERLLSRAGRNGWWGLEYLAGIPGSVGGAVVMNAGGRFGETWDHADLIEGVDRTGTVERLGRDEVAPGYRRTSLPERFIVARARFRVEPGDARTFRRRVGQIMREKRRAQPLHEPTFGSVFKNPELEPESLTAGRLIEACGLAGHQVGGAQISPKHANFIINRGGARASEVLALMRAMREAVWERFEVRLEPEVVAVGFSRSALEDLYA